MLEISQFPYSKDQLDVMRDYPHMQNWPVTYVIYNDKEAYVGETLDAIERTRQHLAEPEHNHLKNICVITDSTYNKSVILDLESFLIKYMGAEGTYRLQNGNEGVQDHNYYQRQNYNENFQEVWKGLMQRGIVRRSLYDIENSDLFKYSPYKSLRGEQEQALAMILRNLRNNLNPGAKSVTLVEGCAGTGKTVLAVYLIKLLTEITSNYVFWEDTADIGYVAELKAFREVYQGRQLKIGFVVPMQSLRKTLQKVFKSIRGLSPKMILGPTEVMNDEYDILVVDEAHRLRQRKALSQYPVFDKCNEHFGLGNDGNELDWILRSSKWQILFYDASQSVKPADIDPEIFRRTCQEHLSRQITLYSQLRCLGGADYIAYVKAVLRGDHVEDRPYFDNYELRFYDDAARMFHDIQTLDAEYGLCRTVAGYGFKWASKKDKAARDVHIGDLHAQWNTTSTDWVSQARSVQEIGCIHTVQGYDLNYCGVIYGPEIRYDTKAQRIVIDKSAYHDTLGKAAVKSDRELHDYIINIYATLMTRAIRGTFVYVCDPDLREYLRQFFG